MTEASRAKTVQGDLSAFSVFDITQTLLSGRKTARITIESGTRRGYVSFQDGQIVHALDDQQNAGEKAVFIIFSWRRGSFTIDFEARPEERNIDASTELLLLEIARQFDEASLGLLPRERTEAAEKPEKAENVPKPVDDRLSATLRSKLASVFRHVAQRTEPARDPHTRHPFDSLLGPMLEMRGSALFLRQGHRPRVKTASGFVTLKDTAVDQNDVLGFLMRSLSEREAGVLREQKEITTLYDGGSAGTFKVGVFEEDGAPTILVTPALRDIPGLAELGVGGVAEDLGRVSEGLVLVAGPMGSGKATMVASLVAHHALKHDKFAVVCSSEQLHAYPAGRGFILQRTRPVGGPGLARLLRGALEQHADVVSVDAVSEAEDLRLLLEFACTGRLVLLSMQALSFGETFAKVQQMTEETAGTRLGRLLAEQLRAVMWMPTTKPNEAASTECMIIGREEQELLRKRDFGALRVQHVIRRT